jgi:hypothetical protein
MKTVEKLRGAVPRWLMPQGSLGVSIVGHRQYVGGMWDRMGRLQFDFMVSEGLAPTDVLVDIACGSLRAGVHFIPYLERGNYLGIEKEAALLEAGVLDELDAHVREEKEPELLVSSAFEFDRFSKQPTFGLAQSLFTHLPPDLISLCFANLRKSAADGCRFYATWFETEGSTHRPARPHDHKEFRYTREEMQAFGDANCWSFRYIGGWKHPRGQIVTEYRAV